MDLSVIIPTCNRAPILARCVQALAAQDYDRSAFEIIVGDDGSGDDTRRCVQRLQAQVPVAVHYLYQANQGANAARNRALAVAGGTLVLFVNDDTIACPALVRRHVEMHRAHRADADAVLGRMIVHPEIGAGLFSRLHLDGCYEALGEQRVLDWRSFFTCNVSTKRAFLLQHGQFETRLRYHEDLEFGARLDDHGLRVFYDPEAIGYHYHRLDEAGYLAMARRDGTALAQWYRLAPERTKQLALLRCAPAMTARDRWRLRSADLLLSRWTMPVLRWVARAAAARSQTVALACYRKLYQRIRRQAVQEELCR